MTNKEAIEYLNNTLNIAYFSSKDIEALELAIKALEDVDESYDDGYALGYSVGYVDGFAGSEGVDD